MHNLPEALGPTIYRIRIKGSVDQSQAQNLGMAVDENDRQESTLYGIVVDQASLIGLINTLYDYGYTLLAVESQSA